ncbi:hypothetical protein D9613_005253 [Agrocybe pediades]|uniref:DUF676 domain-containing protein n=1 Tax=Agrocybe pediades TaxID=84607 RepID=A0A8H4VRA8_9AGAR|nr:hypothetical protein D9613_005253 [Agrocybe pediades]
MDLLNDNPWAQPDEPSQIRGPADSLALTTTKPDLLLLVFIHGFKGTDETFGDFPKRMEHLLSETIPQVKSESIIFPAYETKGELDKAVVRFADWLTTLVVEREVSSGLGAGKAKIVLCGHSMGGLLAADTLRAFVQSRPDDTAPLWPKIVACIAYDTPYFGLHPFVVKNSVTKAAKYANAATTVGSVLLGSFAGLSAKKAADPAPKSTDAESSSSKNSNTKSSQSTWSSWTGAAAVGGALLAGAAAGVAYYKKDDLTNGFNWAGDHLKYVGTLWDSASLDQRIDALIDIERDHGVVFRTLYSVLPPNPLNS